MKGHTVNQHLVIHFSIVKNDRVYQLMVQPGSPYEEAQEVLKEFQEGLLELQKQAQEKEKEAAAVAESQPQ